MPTNRTRRARVATLDHWRVDDLVTGDCFLATGYTPPNNRNGCGRWTADDWADVHAAMQADWDAHGAALMAWWRGDNESFTWHSNRDDLHGRLARCGETQPYALRMFGEPTR